MFHIILNTILGWVTLLVLLHYVIKHRHHVFCPVVAWMALVDLYASIIYTRVAIGCLDADDLTSPFHHAWTLFFMMPIVLVISLWGKYESN